MSVWLGAGQVTAGSVVTGISELPSFERQDVVDFFLESGTRIQELHVYEHVFEFLSC